jgi:hypothetical protein
MRIFGTTKQPPLQPTPYTEPTKQPMSDIPDAEFDIENQPVVCIERDDEDDTITLITVTGSDESWSLFCSDEKHKELVTRFRRKLKLIL